ncbi:MAG: hypothetical protein MUC28_03540 [Planctomycetes bacterium]|nr:hypothetical protein [Planctomycetota bacterium]
MSAIIGTFTDDELRPWPEKWNFRLHIKTKDPLIRDKQEKKYGNGYIAYNHQAKSLELEKTEFEQTLIADSITATNIFLQLLNLAPIAIRPEQIRLYTREAIIRLFGDSNLNGKVHDGIAYVVRLRGALMAQVITHEIAHLAAFSWYRVKHYYDPIDDVNHSYLRQIRGGYRWFDAKPINGGGIFNLLNEAATEMLSHYARRELYRIADYYEPVEKQKLLTHSGYSFILEFLNELLDIISRSEEDIAELRREMLIDYITGTRSFIRKLKIRLPGCLKILARLNHGLLDEVYDAAERLGIKDYRAIVEKRLEKPKPL